MPEIGIRQLKNEASEIIRAVREERVEYIVTLRGKPVAVLRPLAPVEKDADAILGLAADVFSGLEPHELTEIAALIERRPDFFARTAITEE